MDKNNSKSLLDVTGYVPIEMQGDNFPREDVLTAVDTSGNHSTKTKLHLHLLMIRTRILLLGLVIMLQDLMLLLVNTI